MGSVREREDTGAFPGLTAVSYAKSQKAQAIAKKDVKKRKEAVGAV
jgi:hypothetical protein